MLRVTMHVSAGLMFAVLVLAAGAASAAPAEQPAQPHASRPKSIR